MVVLMLPGAGGCHESLPPAADPDRSTAALKTALDAWRDGQSIEALKARSPAIYFNEPACNDRNRLLKYEVESGEQIGVSWRVTVQLTVQPADGKSRDQRASYVINTGDAIVIVRDSMK